MIFIRWELFQLFFELAKVLPDGTVKVLVEGNQRAKIIHITQEGEFYSADLELMKEETGPENEVEVVIQYLLKQFEQYVKLNKPICPEI